MDTFSEKLFDKSGYILLTEYIEDINNMKKNSLWILPLGIGDRIQLMISSLFVRFSWLKELLYVSYPYSWSPSYNILLLFLYKNKIFDLVAEKNEPYNGYYSFFLTKKMFNGRTLSGQGVSKSRSIAMSKAIGEMIERYISSYRDMNKDTVQLSSKEIAQKYPIIYPPKYHNFSDIQKQKHKELRHLPTDVIAWVKGVNLITKEYAYIPRQLTSWFYINTNIERIISSFTSNGSAGYFTKEGAVLRGILEVVQRDAFLVHWLTKTQPSRILEDSLPEELQGLVRMFTSRGLSIYILDITAIQIPTVCVIGISEQADEPMIVVSASSAVTMYRAINNALEEMIISSEVLRSPKIDGELDSENHFSLNKRGRQIYWRGKEKIEKMKWFVTGPVISYQDVCKIDLKCENGDESHLDACLSILESLGNDYFPVVYYPKNSLQEKLGFYIAQVFIPKAFPLYLEEKYATFNSERLQEFAVSINNLNWKLNTDPHMFS